MCKQLGISHAAYYKWLHRTIPEQKSENTKLAELIKEYDERSYLGIQADDKLDQPFQSHQLQQKQSSQNHEEAGNSFYYP